MFNWWTYFKKSLDRSCKKQKFSYVMDTDFNHDVNEDYEIILEICHFHFTF